MTTPTPEDDVPPKRYFPEIVNQIDHDCEHICRLIDEAHRKIDAVQRLIDKS